MPGGAAASRPARRTKPVSQYKLVGTHGVPRVDIPEKVTGKYTYVHNIRVPGMLHGRVVRPRGQGAVRRRHRFAKSLSVDESSIKHIPGAQVVRRERLPRRRRADGVRRDPGAAQLKVKWADPPPLAGLGNLWKQMRELRHAPARRRRGSRSNTGNVDAAFASAAIKVVADATSTTTTAHMPIGPSCCGRRRDAGRRARSSRTRRTRTASRDDARRRCSACRSNKIRVQLLRGLRARSATAPARHDVGAGGGGHVAARRQAGAPPVHALGRARLGQLRPGADDATSAAASTRTATSSRSTFTALRDPPYCATDADRAAGQAGDRRVRDAGPRSTPTTQRRAVQHPEPARRSARRCRCMNNYFKTSSLRAPHGAADGVRAPSR